MAGNGYGTQVTWVFNPTSHSWSNMNPAGSANSPGTNCCNFTSEYDPVTRKIFMRDPKWVCAYDFDKNVWERTLEWSHTWSSGKNVIDTKRHLLFTIGSGEFLVYDIGSNRNVSASWATTGEDSVVRGYGVGAAYDSKNDAIVGWTGGGPYVLDLQTKVWSGKSGIGAPSQPLQWGTYGRFRYIAEDNVFILINGVDSDVYFYKSTAAGGSSLFNKLAKSKRPRQINLFLDGASIKVGYPDLNHDLRGRNYPGKAPSHAGATKP